MAGFDFLKLGGVGSHNSNYILERDTSEEGEESAGLQRASDYLYEQETQRLYELLESGPSVESILRCMGA